MNPLFLVVIIPLLLVLPISVSASLEKDTTPGTHITAMPYLIGQKPVPTTDRRDKQIAVLIH
jgi:hypothetical protein